MRRATPLLPLLLVLGACAAPRCRNQVAQRVPAPDGVHDVVVYHTDCGAQDGASTQVAILPHDATLPDLPTNVLSLSRPVAVRARWAAADRLLLAYPADVRVVTRLATSPEGIAVSFEPQAR
jgi:hypothetical protein